METMAPSRVWVQFASRLEIKRDGLSIKKTRDMTPQCVFRGVSGAPGEGRAGSRG